MRLNLVILSRFFLFFFLVSGLFLFHALGNMIARFKEEGPRSEFSGFDSEKKGCEKQWKKLEFFKIFFFFHS